MTHHDFNMHSGKYFSKIHLRSKRERKLLV